VAASRLGMIPVGRLLLKGCRSLRQDLLLRVVAQEVGHVGVETTASSPPSTSWGAAISLAGFQVFTTGRFWVSTEAQGLRAAHSGLPGGSHARACLPRRVGPPTRAGPLAAPEWSRGPYI
jgi:hypothetical protein